MIDFKFEITAGQVLIAVSILIGIIKLSNKFGKLEQKVNLMYSWWVKHLQLNGSTESGD